MCGGRGKLQMLNTGMKRQEVCCRFRLLPKIRSRIAGKKAPDVTYGSPRILSWALVFNIQATRVTLKLSNCVTCLMPWPDTLNSSRN